MNTQLIVVKYPDDEILGEGVNEKLIPRKHLGNWQLLTKRYPSLKATRLFNPKHRKTIERLRTIVEARRRNAESKAPPTRGHIDVEVTAAGTALELPYRPPRFDNYLAVRCPDSDGAQTFVINEIKNWPGIEACYLRLDDSSPTGLKKAIPPFDFTVETDPKHGAQDHLWPDQNGLGAEALWLDLQLAGATGELQDFVDIERGWDLGHEDLLKPGGLPNVTLNDTLGVGNSADPIDVQHGTSVLGIVCASHNNVGRVGFAPYLHSATVIPYRDDVPSSLATLDAIALQLDKVEASGVGAAPGQGISTVILIEAQAKVWDPTKKQPFLCNFPVEVYPDAFDAIRFAFELGITVIEPAGNGALGAKPNQPLAVNLGSYAKSGNKWGKLERERNPTNDTGFPQRQGDSGAIMVAAAKARNKALVVIPVWTKTEHSNYGKRINCFASGEQVSTLDSWAGSKYRDDFSGTSSASAIIAGAALCLQGVYRENKGVPMDPQDVRTALSDETCGTKNNDVAMYKIGVMPDLPKVVAAHVLIP